MASSYSSSRSSSSTTRSTSSQALLFSTSTLIVTVGALLGRYYYYHNYGSASYRRRRRKTTSCHNNDDDDDDDDEGEQQRCSTRREQQQPEGGHDDIHDSPSIEQNGSKTIIASANSPPADKNDNNNNNKSDEVLSFLQKQRQEERTGRIRAEVRLRETVKKLQELKNTVAATVASDEVHDNNNNNNNDRKHCTSKSLLLESIGMVVSPFTKRMGTPRQPQLVPNSRGYIQLSSNCPPAALDGIMEYSHIWVIFEFHANTDVDNDDDGHVTHNKKKTKRTKIRPPRAPCKVGQLASRSPHRPNPMGLSLVSLTSWNATTKQLHISGLDLVNGTPVYDIKPCVPWDIPGYYNYQQEEPTQQQSSTSSSSSLTNQLPIKVPWWVIQEDEIRNVEFTSASLEQIQQAVAEQRLAPFYTVHNNGYEEAKLTIQQILAQDPRSSHKGLKHNARGSTTAAANCTGEMDNNKNNNCSNSTAPKDYNMIFGQVQISFIVNETGVCVTSITPITFDPNNYVDGVPLILKQQL